MAEDYKSIRRKRRDGGRAEGEMASERLDRQPRREMGLHNSYSTGATFSPPGRGIMDDREITGGTLGN